jgi:ribonucleoside-diphosphate reductase alpha chain
MPSNEGYINVVAVMQKFFDQAISGNWSYNPTHFEGNEVPMSVMLRDLLTTYKMGWKTSYYQNTYDYKSDDDIVFVKEEKQPLEREEFTGTDQEYEEYCDACAI